MTRDTIDRAVARGAGTARNNHAPNARERPRREVPVIGGHEPHLQLRTSPPALGRVPMP
jgi:hypothetical protein